MKYLTKEWYDLCQQTDLHFGVRVHRGAENYDEALYSRLYKRKENVFVNEQREIYNVDPRFMLEQDDGIIVSLDAFISGETISEEDTMIYHMSTEEKERIQQLIEEYDSRPPFDEEKSKEEFRFIQELERKEIVDRLPNELYQQIADIRVFSLGYCTEDILRQLKELSKENEKKVNQILNEYSKAQEAEIIPQDIQENYGFHDCLITELTVGKKDVMIHLDTSGGFTNFNEVTFSGAEIIKQDGPINGSTWLYEELYGTENGYEAHILFAGEEMAELVIQCHDIIIEEK